MPTVDPEPEVEYYPAHAIQSIREGQATISVTFQIHGPLKAALVTITRDLKTWRQLAHDGRIPVTIVVPGLQPIGLIMTPGVQAMLTAFFLAKPKRRSANV